MIYETLMIYLWLFGDDKLSIGHNWWIGICKKHLMAYKTLKDLYTKARKLGKCDIMGCKQKATHELYINLKGRLKEAEQDIKYNRFYEMNPKTNKFQKVKNYGQKN